MDVAETDSEDADEPEVRAPRSRARSVARFVLLAILAAIGVAGIVAAIMLPTLHLGRHPIRPGVPRSAALVHRHPGIAIRQHPRGTQAGDAATDDHRVVPNPPHWRRC